jgi:hypothetical protein
MTTKSPTYRSLAEAVVHFNIVMDSLKDNRILQPLIALITDSGTMANAFLPTMPQDDLADVKEVLLRVQTTGENPTFYQCPNGHPYVIGNCGRPAVHDTCRQCGEPIGGQYHVLNPGNRAVTDDDSTRRGHILGAPLPRDPVPERQMTATSTSLLRLLLHMSMYLGAAENPQAISSLISPAVPNVAEFLWQHMSCDIYAIHRAISHSIDDVIVLVHLFLNHAITAVQHVDYRDDVQLGTKQARQHWENTFVSHYIAPVLADINDRLQQSNHDMVNDERLGNNELLRMLYEVDVDITSTDEIVEVPALWRYRARISLEHMKREFEQQQGAGEGETKNCPFPVLDLFLKEEHHLRILRLLPRIIRLHRLLITRFNRSIDHAEATTLKIGKFIEEIAEDNVRQEFYDLIHDFITAWDCVRLSLINYAFDGRTLPAEYAQKSIDEDSCLAVLLPSLRGYGLCSVALTYFLFEKHNDFLEKYSIVTKNKLEPGGVDIRDAGNAHLVSYHSERDLQPIILANCNYSLEFGKGTRIEYDFGMMEKQIEERFIRGRPRLFIQEFDFVLFHEDFTNATIFSQLRSRVQQEPLRNVTASSIKKDLRQKLTDVNDLLASLDITIGFLVSVGGEPNAGLVRFMTDTLRMKPHQQLLRVIHSCRLMHVESLWLLLSYMRSCMQADHGQDPFDTIEGKYTEKIPEDQIDRVKLGLHHINLETFLPSLHECILFKVTIKQDPNHEDYVDNVDQPLNDVLHAYMEAKGLVTIPALTDGRFPAEIKLKHCVDTWRMAHKLTRRQLVR